MPKTVIQHVLGRLNDIGINDIFGVAGDFAFPIQDAIVQDARINWVGCCNELNAGYAADGYARLRGVGALSTTYGVGELSAISAVGGAYAENVPIVHLTGMPARAAQHKRQLVHHTLGNGEFDFFSKMADPVVCASAILTPQNAVYETERLIAEAFYHRRPVYIAIPRDVADQEVLGSAQPLDPPRSNPDNLKAATEAIVSVLDSAEAACILPGWLVSRLGLQSQLQAFVDASGMPFATMFGDKSVLNEQQPSFIGMYDGRLMNPDVRAYVESCDRVVTVGTLMTDFNTGAFTARLDPMKTIAIKHHYTRVGQQEFHDVEMGDVLSSLLSRVKHRGRETSLQPASLGPVTGSGGDAITADALYPRWAEFLRPNDIVVTETGSSSMGLAFAQMPKGATFHNQALWGAIGWATPAAFGAAVAAPDRRVVLITGEGSHQLTAQEISQMGRRGLKPTVFVLNNSGYLIERLLCRDPDIAYNDLAQWHYSELPHALGCDGWYTTRVTTCGELDQALQQAGQNGSASYIEVVTDEYAAPPLPQKMHENRDTLYAT
ncbi:MAG TPA: thiamine pyrophosphate-binding protein [Streptosporangiaceae bacterium]|jgi:indolepyruvate decarboxylase|nr:thiamine pyrophosphate-binding protein [Streptosporangiaceae bacterium]